MRKPTTRELIEEKADALFYEQGFEATSFADVAAAVGISRGNFYHHFKSKDEMLAAVIARRMAKTKAMLHTWEADATPKARISSFVRLLITNQTKIMSFGCPVGTLATELAKLDHFAKDKAVDIFDLFRDWLTLQCDALGHGDNAQKLALHLLSRSQGAAVMASAYADAEILKSEVQEIENWLDTLPSPI